MKKPMNLEVTFVSQEEQKSFLGQKLLPFHPKNYWQVPRQH